jgi:hypothetical protein
LIFSLLHQHVVISCGVIREFTKFPAPVENHTLAKLGDPSKPIILKEHIVDTTHNHISKSAIVEHSFNSKHLICFEKTRILASTPYYSSRVIHEALEIEKTS